MNDIFTALIDNIKLRDADKVDVVGKYNEKEGFYYRSNIYF
jgi:hypothetical protein